jgi:hypothetical protein
MASLPSNFERHSLTVLKRFKQNQYKEDVMSEKEYVQKKYYPGHLSRREFLGRCTAYAAGISAMSYLASPASAKPSSVLGLAADKNSKTRIRLVLAHPSSKEPCWPNIGYDFEGKKREIVKMLRKECPDIEFLPVTAGKDEDAKEILQLDKDIDGYIVYLVGCLWGRVPEIIAASGKPTVFIDNLFAGSGKFLTGYARARREGQRVVGISSSDFNDAVEAVCCIDCIHKLRQSTALVVGGSPDKKIEELFGTSMQGIDFPEISAAYKNADSSRARKWSERWIKEAAKIIEPSRLDIEQSAVIYIAMLDLMEKHSARAITVNCLGGFYGGHLPAYPCLGFMQLNNDGYVGACEADQRSTITMLLMTYLVNRPGFISDPVIDTAKNQIIYAHCVAPTRVFVANVDLDLACRNKLAVEVQGDVYKLMNHWDTWGWHRVTFYGDFKRQVYNIASLLGFEVIEEA